MLAGQSQVPRGPQLRLLLISPRGPLYRHGSGIWKKSLRYAPLTLTTLAALVPPELTAAITLVDEGIEAVDPNVDADLVGISAITGTAPRSYELADQFRARGIPVILGGVHPTLMPDEAQEHADAVVVGYAEHTWPKLLRDFARGHLRARYVQGDELSLAGLPLPRRDLLPSGRFVTAETIEATRGCIHRCTFCVVPTAWGGAFQKPVPEVVAEIRQMRARRLLFLDLNLVADIAYAKELFAALVPLRLRWGGLATTAIAFDEELLDLAARSGCRGLLIGLESLAAPALTEANKGFARRQRYTQVVERLHDRRIALMGTFVFGFDHDTADTFAETLEFVNETQIDLPRYAILTPFPGTPLFQRLEREGRILTRDWCQYDAQHVVYQPKQMTPDALWKGNEWAWKETYSYRSIANRLAGSRVQLGLSLSANLGYRFYAHRLRQFYTCDWRLGLFPNIRPTTSREDRTCA